MTEGMPDKFWMDASGTVWDGPAITNDDLPRTEYHHAPVWRDFSEIAGKHRGMETDILVYNKNWHLRKVQTATLLADGTIRVIGHHFAFDHDTPTHWQPITPPEES